MTERNILGKPSIYSALRFLDKRLSLIERSRPQLGGAVPMVPLAEYKIEGLIASGETTFDNVLRGDNFVTSRWLDYDIQTSHTFATGSPQIDWRIRLFDTVDATYYTLASGDDGGSADVQFAGIVDLYDVIGPEIHYRFARFDLDIQLTSGGGQAAVRLNKPLLFRMF